MRLQILRWVPGLLVVAGFSAATVTAITHPMRQSIAELASEVAELGLQETETLRELGQLRLAQAGAVALPIDAIWTKGQSVSVRIALQEALVSKANAAGLQLVSFGESIPPAEVTHPTLASELELIGTHDELGAFLASLETTTPALAVSYLWLRQLPPDPAQPGSPVSIRMTVWGFLGEDGAQ